MRFSEEDLVQISAKGISREKVEDQIAIFKAGIPFVHLDKAAVIGEGISKFSKDDELELIQRFERSKKKLSLLKFVPASGAASRMFKTLFNFLDTYDPKKEILETYIARTKAKEIGVFFDQWKSLPFYEIVQARISGKSSTTDEEKYLFVQEILQESKLDYGFFPKGLLPFHKYEGYVSTAFEEHLKEASRYAESEGKAKLHFTISPQHDKMFKMEYDIASERVSMQSGKIFEVDYSFQKESTDTIAVDLDNLAFRNADGSLLFRPGGHGALIENLNEQDADIIFIKNIDNVVTTPVLEVVANSKKVLAGLLLKVQEKVFNYSRQLEGNEANTALMEEIKAFLEADLNVRFTNSFEDFSPIDQLKVLQDKMNRPIRICGMVKNEGEPGGGPFWVKDDHARSSLQIVESAQIDMDNESQVSILKRATHFNPVDIVCGVKNYKGEKFDLHKFVDAKLGFITGKTQEGRALKALELPGLWNGAMAFWNTIFVEVPVATFNPVKTVNDLLRSSHQIE
tara:strand:- start:1860 stop:3398 length:1539 start_codon:yes stop_codon:yes gene_type:complete